jgi:cyclopropane fatty-acyl-phospholipid synthase-like methyltransferase
MDDNKPPEFFYRIFDASLPRLGAGDNRSTIQALDMLRSAKPGLTDKIRVLDLGCGNGAQTIELAKHINGTIIALDNHQPFLDELQRRAEAEGVSEKIQLCLKDMATLVPADGPFDLVWCEGAIFGMGFREGLTVCHGLLTPDGLMAVSELTWFQPDPPEECRQFYENGYPAMVDIDTNLAIIKSCGYENIGHFTLPESAWLESFYNPLEKHLQTLRKQYSADPAKAEIMDMIQMEIDIYRKYSAYYGNAFFLMQRVGL